MAFQHVKVVAALIFNELKQILITQRPPGSYLAGLWEFPGGKVEEGESQPQALIREIKEETNLDIEVGHHVATEHVEYPEKRVTIYFYSGRRSVPGQQIVPEEIADFRWIPVEDLRSFNFPQADLHMVKKMQGSFIQDWEYPGRPLPG